VPTPELEQQLLLLARRLAKPVRMAGQSGFTVLDRPAYQTLLRIVEDGPLRSTALAKLVGVDLSVISRQVTSLEHVGFVHREPDPADARAALVTVTDAGREAYEKTRQARTELLQEVLGSWPEHDRHEFERLLTNFTSQLEAAIAERLAASP